ncbi:hypothetical protein AMTRI_Chr11g149890 [Amborella trichopoda]
MFCYLYPSISAEILLPTASTKLQSLLHHREGKTIDKSTINRSWDSPIKFSTLKAQYQIFDAKPSCMKTCPILSAFTLHINQIFMASFLSSTVSVVRTFPNHRTHKNAWCRIGNSGPFELYHERDLNLSVVRSLWADLNEKLPSSLCSQITPSGPKER